MITDIIVIAVLVIIFVLGSKLYTYKRKEKAFKYITEKTKERLTVNNFNFNEDDISIYNLITDIIYKTYRKMNEIDENISITRFTTVPSDVLMSYNENMDNRKYTISTSLKGVYDTGISEALDDFIINNRLNYSLDNYIKTNNKLIGSEDEYGELVHGGGCLTLAKIGYNRGRNTAVVSVESDWAEDYLILRKVGLWEIECSYPMSMWDRHPHPWPGEEF